MARTERQQVIDSLKKAERPLICVRKQWTPDGIASALGLASMLEHAGKRPEIVCEGFKPAPHLGFLPKLERIRSELTALRKFIISVDVSRNKVGELSYEAKDDKLHIYLKPKTGNFESRHVQTGTTDYHHDLIITLDAPDLNSLGAMSEHAADFFYHSPVLNIDHAPANEHYGQINHVDLTATSVGEMLFLLAKDMDHPVDEHLATVFLTGIVAKTRSFKTGSLTPRVLSLSSELVSLGARRDAIVSSLYRTKDIPTLKLWGRALARMKHDPAHGIASSVLTRQDFALSGAEEDALTDVIEELISSSPEAETVALLHETKDGHICCLIRNEKRRNADRLTAPWKGEGDRVQARCFLKGISLQQAEKDVLAHLRKELANA